MGELEKEKKPIPITYLARPIDDSRCHSCWSSACIFTAVFVAGCRAVVLFVCWRRRGDLTQQPNLSCICIVGIYVRTINNMGDQLDAR